MTNHLWRLIVAVDKILRALVKRGLVERAFGRCKEHRELLSPRWNKLIRYENSIYNNIYIYRSCLNSSQRSLQFQGLGAEVINDRDLWGQWRLNITCIFIIVRHFGKKEQNQFIFGWKLKHMLAAFIFVIFLGGYLYKCYVDMNCLCLFNFVLIITLCSTCDLTREFGH